jgi:hypothetical protein
MARTQVVQSPSGKWFADHQGWGRKFDTEEAARKYAESFETGDDSER